MNDILAGYAAAATPELIARYEALSCAEIYAPVLDLFPPSPARVADIGAGTGRDAGWLAGQGHAVLAVEPVAPFRLAGVARHVSPRIEWLDDRLPELGLAQERGRFGFVLLGGVWQHLDEPERARAMTSLARLTAPGGLLVMSLRHGPGVPGRAVFPIAPEATIESARGEGFRLVRRAEVQSIQPGNRASGVWWTWLALRMAGSSADDCDSGAVAG